MAVRPSPKLELPQLARKAPNHDMQNMPVRASIESKSTETDTSKKVLIGTTVIALMCCVGAAIFLILSV